MPPVVRVATGAWAGRRLHAAAAPSRPATARMRDSIFNRPDVRARVGGRVLDLYAGAGLLGVEALSNGASHVDFVERDRRACEVVRRNVGALDASERATVHCRTVERWQPRATYDLIFADPPYDHDALPALVALVAKRALQPDGLLLWRYPRTRAGPARLASLVRVEERRYGDGVLGTYRLAEEPR